MGRKRVDAVGRHIRLPRDLDRWLARKAKEEGAATPQPLIRRILKAYMLTQDQAAQQEQPEAA